MSPPLRSRPRSLSSPGAPPAARRRTCSGSRPASTASASPTRSSRTASPSTPLCRSRFGSSIAAGGTKVSKKVMGDYGIGVILVLGLVHLAIVVLAASENGGEGTAPILLFADEFDPSKDQLGVMTQLFAFRNFCAEEWPHVLIWDLFVGRAIWLDGLSRGTIVTWHSVLLTNLIGPPGLVLHALTCLFTGNALPLAVGGSVPEEEPVRPAPLESFCVANPNRLSTIRSPAAPTPLTTTTTGAAVRRPSARRRRARRRARGGRRASSCARACGYQRSARRRAWRAVLAVRAAAARMRRAVIVVPYRSEAKRRQQRARKLGLVLKKLAPFPERCTPLAAQPLHPARHGVAPFTGGAEGGVGRRADRLEGEAVALVKVFRKCVVHELVRRELGKRLHKRGSVHAADVGQEVDQGRASPDPHIRAAVHEPRRLDGAAPGQPQRGGKLLMPAAALSGSIVRLRAEDSRPSTARR